MRKNDDIILRITGMTAEGAGVGREEGMAVFVPFAAPGELVRAHVVKVHKSYAFAKMTEVLEGADDRIEPDCPVFGRCGGCVYRHLSYEAELAVKRRRVEDALTRIGGITVPVPPVMGSERVDGYRNKAQYPVAREKGELRIGFFSPPQPPDCRLPGLPPPAAGIHRGGKDGGRLDGAVPDPRLRRRGPPGPDPPHLPAQGGGDRADHGLPGGKRQDAAPFG